MGRFDPIEGNAYGECATCGITLATDGEADAHRKETMPAGGRSHSTRGFNPPRPARIQSFIDAEVQDAIRDVIERLRDAVDDGDLSSAEVQEALGWYSDFADEWSKAGDPS